MQTTLANPHEEAFRLVLAHRTMLLAYVRAIVHDPETAEDTLADVSVELARSWDGCDRSRPFGPWARGVARRVALANLRKRRSLPALLDADTLESVGIELDAFGDEMHLEARKESLRHCLERLGEPHRRLVRMRYFENRSYKDIAETLRRSVDALYVAFARIHRLLEDCIRKQGERA